MTCFSIQKSLFFAALFFSLTAACSGAFAQTAKPETPRTAKPQPTATQKMTASAPIVIELYTSSNCSACIYADRMLYDAMKDKQVIALSCHVKDTTSASITGEDPAETMQEQAMDPCVFRHWTFAARNKAADITLAMPTLFFNGQESMSGSEMGYFGQTLGSYHYAGKNKVQEALMQWKDKDTISIHLPKADESLGSINASVWLVRYKDMAVERLYEGVNAGRVLRFSNIVQNTTHIAKWHGNPRVVNVDVTPPQGGKERGGYAVLVAPLLGTPYLVAGKLGDYPVAADLKEEAEKRARAKAATEGKPVSLPSDKQPENPLPTR